MKTLPVEMQTVNVGTGNVEKTETVQFGIMPPKKGACSICGVPHEAHLPHNAQSLYYQYAFRGEHGRWPTWADACAHVTPEMRAFWKEKIGEAGQWTEPEGDPISQPYIVQ